MGKTLLIAGSEGAFGTGLVQDLLTRGDRVAASLGPGAEHPPLEQDWRQNLRYVQWNARSPLSARSLVLETLNAFERIDEAAAVYAPEGEDGAFHELSSADIERAVDEKIKGYAFFLREILGLFQKQGSGVLTFVSYDGGLPVLSPLQAAAGGAFRALAAALFAQYRNEPVVIRGFYSAVPEAGEFRRYILGFSDRPDKTAGKWLKYTGLTSLLSFGRK